MSQRAVIPLQYLSYILISHNVEKKMSANISILYYSGILMVHVKVSRPVVTDGSTANLKGHQISPARLENAIKVTAVMTKTSPSAPRAGVPLCCLHPLHADSHAVPTRHHATLMLSRRRRPLSTLAVLTGAVLALVFYGAQCRVSTGLPQG